MGRTKFLPILFIFLIKTQVLLAGTSVLGDLEVIQALDATCADTWCEGGFNYIFHSVWCSEQSNSCKVRFTMVDYSGTHELGYVFSSNEPGISARLESSGSVAYAVSCQVDGVKSYDKLLKSKFDLEDGFFSKLNSCIRILEEMLDPRGEGY